MDIKERIVQHKWSLIFTLTLILLESIVNILFPLFIGKAISDYIQHEDAGIYHLAVLGAILTILGATRRFFDSRFYAKLYTSLSITTNEGFQKNQTSLKTARLSMLSEMVKFAEFQIPDIIQHTIGLIGILIIIAYLNIGIFVCALVTGLFVVAIYICSASATYRHNQEYNNELETQVDIIGRGEEESLLAHLKRLMHPIIKLSDIETFNFSLSWLVMVGLLIVSIIFAAEGNTIIYATLFSLLMYVFQFVESMVSLPLYYQQWVRLHEIGQRLHQLL